MKKTINGYEYMGQYADKYYWLRFFFRSNKSFIEVYDKTKDKIKRLKVFKNRTVRINNESISIDLLNG